METILQDVKYGIRTLAGNPGVLIVAVFTLALGIGANTTIFSVIYGALLRPLPYDHSEDLMFITEWSQQVPNMSFSVANFKDLRDESKLFESFVASRGQNYVMTGLGDAERLAGRQITAGFFPTMRLRPILGREFTPDEDKPGAERVVLLSEGFWARRFGRSPGVLGMGLTLNGETYTVIGVLPARFYGGWRQVDVWASLGRLEDQIGGSQNRGNHPGIYVIGRVKPGTTVEQARTEVKNIAERLARQHPETNSDQSMTLITLHDSYVGSLQSALMVLMAAVGFVLLIACANVANLLLGRAAARNKEIAVRAALGAARSRLVRQMLTESMLLALAGGIAGVLTARLGLNGLLATLPRDTPFLGDVHIDLRVLAFTAALSLMTGILFGLIPAWQVTRPVFAETLKEGGRGTGTAGSHRARNALVVAEVSLSLILMVGAGLMLRSFLRVIEADPGFDSRGVLTATLSLPQATDDNPVAIRDFNQRVLQEVRSLPGVQAAGSALPLLGSWQTAFVVEGRPVPEMGKLPSTDISRVSTDYFWAMGVKLLRGRVFTEQDNADAPPVCIIDETFVRAYWPDEDPIGKKIHLGGPHDKQPWLEIVGVVAHVKNYGVDQASRVETYIPFVQRPIGSFTLIVRTAGSPADLTSAVRASVRSVNPNVPIFNARTLEQIASDSVAQRKLAVTLIALFAAIALILAAVGIYGVMSYAVVQRTYEIGMRAALGARRSDIFRLVVGQGMLYVALGTAIGAACAFVLSRLLTSLLFEIGATDPSTFSATIVLLALVALLACYIPARRAARVDPIIALRRE